MQTRTSLARPLLALTIALLWGLIEIAALWRSRWLMRAEQRGA